MQQFIDLANIFMSSSIKYVTFIIRLQRHTEAFCYSTVNKKQSMVNFIDVALVFNYVIILFGEYIYIFFYYSKQDIMQECINQESSVIRLKVTAILVAFVIMYKCVVSIVVVQSVHMSVCSQTTTQKLPNRNV